MNTVAIDQILGFKQKRDLHGLLRTYVNEYGQRTGAEAFWDEVLVSLQEVARRAFFNRLREAELAQSAVSALFRESADTSDLESSKSNVEKARTIYTVSKQLPADSSWKLWVGEEDVDNFRPHERSDEDSFPDLPEVAENAEFQDAVKLNRRDWLIRTGKRGRTFHLSFEAQINDDIGRLKTLSERMGVAALRTLAREVADAMVSNIHSPYDGFQMWCYDHLNVLPSGLTGINLDSANLLQTLCNIPMQQRDSQKDVKSGIKQGNLISNPPKYMVVGLNQWVIVWHLLNDETVPDAAGDQVSNPMRKYTDLGLQLILDPYLDELAGGSCDNVYVFTDPKQYTPALTMVYLKGTGRGPILAMSRGDWKVKTGSNMIEDFDLFLKRTFLVMETAKLNAQIWEGTAALIPAFQPGQGETQNNPYD